jgi:CheY-like chemotaxis protein
MNDNSLCRALEMNALIFCQDNLFLPTIRRVCNRLGLEADVVADYNDAVSLLRNKRFDAIVMDWQEIVNLGEFLQKIASSKINQKAVRVAIARDLMDLRQASSDGVECLMHKPASVVQITRCLEAMQLMALKQRRKHHRESVRIPATIRARDIQLLGSTIVNISNRGLGLLLDTHSCGASAALACGSDIVFSFGLPGTPQTIRGTGTITWINRNGSAGIEFRTGNAGVEFQNVSATDAQNLEQWLAVRFECLVSNLRESLRLTSA